MLLIGKAVKKILKTILIMVVVVFVACMVIKPELVNQMVDMLQRSISVSSENVVLQTEIQYNESAYLDQSFALHITREDGKTINTIVKNVYMTDAAEKKLVGYEVIPIEDIFILGYHSGGYTIGYSRLEDTVPVEDFTISVKFKDKTVTYSMMEEGLFIPQDNVKHYDNL